MKQLHQALTDYLSVRRALGYKLERDEKLLVQFLTYLEAEGVNLSVASPVKLMLLSLPLSQAPTDLYDSVQP